MDTSPSKIREGDHGTLKSYAIGLLLCLALTLAAFFLVSEHILNGLFLSITITSLALLQVFFQLYFFLHLGTEPKPHWNLLSFLFMLLVVVILVFGTLWIMYNLDYRVMK